MNTPRIFLVVVFVSITSFLGFSQQKEGYVEVKGGKIWYTILGDGPGYPLIVIHGGPGSRSCGSIEAYSKLGKDRPVILFDQLESGMSDHPNDTTLWKLPYFVDQVDSLRKALKLEKCHLLGSSWGGAVAVEYMLTGNTDGVQSVIFAGPLLSTPQWIKDAKVLLSRLPQPVQDTIVKYEAIGEYDAPAYQEATMIFYDNYLTRNIKEAVKLPEACRNVPGFNAYIYEYMWGPTEFNATGTLKHFDRIDRLHELKVPVLFIIGEYDEVLPETVKLYQLKIPGSEAVIISGSGHAKTIDNPKDYIEALRKFLKGVEDH